jgi:hypothetical protein
MEVTMKNSIWVLLLMMMIQGSIANAKEKCSIDKRVSAITLSLNPYTEDPSHSLLDSPFEYSFSTWQECYAMAVHLAQNSENTFYYTIHWYVDGGIRNQSLRNVYFNWHFNDGWVEDSKGTVNYLSNLSQPGLGWQGGSREDEVNKTDRATDELIMPQWYLQY